MGGMPYKKGWSELVCSPFRQVKSLLWPHEIAARRSHLWRRQPNPHQTLHLLMPWSWDFPAPNLWAVSLCPLYITQGLYDSKLNGQRQALPFHSSNKLKTHLNPIQIVHYSTIITHNITNTDTHTHGSNHGETCFCLFLLLLHIVSGLLKGNGGDRDRNTLLTYPIYLLGGNF